MKKIIFLMTVLILRFIMIGSAQYQKLHDFSSTDGYNPEGDLVTDSTFLYGMTSAGGANDCGIIFRLRTDGTGYQKLHDFTFATGKTPDGSLVLYKGLLFGVSRMGGPNGGGVLFSVDTAGNNYQVLHSFVLQSDSGYFPTGTLLLVDSTLYGMTELGGVYDTHGVIYSIRTDGLEFKPLWGYDEPEYCRLGDRLTYFHGYLYGMISEGQGNNSAGSVFRIHRLGYGFSNIFDFSGTNGAAPLGFPVIVDSLVYGMTSEGGPDSAGVIFRMHLEGLFYTILNSFTPADPGGFPRGSLLADSVTLYGMSRGNTPDLGCIFKINTNGSGYTILHNFQSGTDGYYPDGSLILLNGRIYGMTEKGGAEDAGVIFSYSLVPQGIEDHKMLPEICVSPNPAQDFIQVTSSDEIQNIIVLDLNGKIMTEIFTPGKSFTIRTSSFPEGVYIIRCTGRDFMVNRKLVKSAR